VAAALGHYEVVRLLVMGRLDVNSIIYFYFRIWSQTPLWATCYMDMKRLIESAARDARLSGSGKLLWSDGSVACLLNGGLETGVVAINDTENYINLTQVT